MTEVEDRTRPVIVVGVDGSPAGKAALRWAVEHATREHGTVRAVSVAYRPELMPATSFALQPHGLRGPEPDPEQRAQWLRSQVDEARAGIHNAAPVVAVNLVGDAETELTRQAADADLLVVGGHGQGQLAEVFLGSVAAGTVRHASCPVVVIPTKVTKRMTDTAD